VEWRAVIYDDGIQSSRSFTVPSNSQRDADREADRVRAELRAARAAAAKTKPARRDPGTVGKLAADWLDQQRRIGSPSSVKGYKGIVRTIDQRFGTTPVDALTREDVRTWCAELSAKGMTPATLRHYHAVLRWMLSDAMIDGKIQANPASRTKLPESPKPAIRLPRDADVIKVLAKLEGDLLVAVRIAASCALRRGEICALRWNAIEGRDLVVRAGVAEGENGAVVKSTKSYRERTVALDYTTMRVLARHRMVQREFARQLHRKWSPDWFILANLAEDPSGRSPLSPSWLSHAWQRARDRVNIGLHGLRHWYASRMLESGEVTVAELASWLGHAQVSTTLNMYVHADPERRRTSARVIGKLLG
jgi:integrase